MPEVVATYAETKSIKECLMIQRRIVNDYLNDMAKYAISGDKIKARECFQSIPVQLAKENKKFQYSVVKKGIQCPLLRFKFTMARGQRIDIESKPPCSYCRTSGF